MSASPFPTTNNVLISSKGANAAHANATLDFESAPVDVKVLHANVADDKEGVFAHSVAVADLDADGREPTEEEYATLRKVPAGMPWPVRTNRQCG